MKQQTNYVYPLLRQISAETCQNTVILKVTQTILIIAFGGAQAFCRSINHFLKSYTHAWRLSLSERSLQFSFKKLKRYLGPKTRQTMEVLDLLELSADCNYGPEFLMNSKYILLKWWHIDYSYQGLCNEGNFSRIRKGWRKMWRMIH